jgi:hypothetical protein
MFRALSPADVATGSSKFNVPRFGGMMEGARSFMELQEMRGFDLP